MTIKLPPPPIRSPFFDAVKNIAHDWLSWFELVYAVGKEKGDKGDTGPAGMAGPAGADGPAGAEGATGPTGSANINGTAGTLIKFTDATTGGNSIAHETSADNLQIEGTQITKQSVSNDVAVYTGYTMITGSIDVVAGVTLDVQMGAELICL